MSKNNKEEDRAKVILLTEKLVQYYVTGIEPTPEMKEEASNLNIDFLHIKSEVESLYELEDEEEEHDVWF